MTPQSIQTSIKIGIATALSIILFQVSNIFLVYKYFKFDYYVTAIDVLFLIAGFFIPKFNTGQVVPGADDKTDPLLNLTARELAILQLIVAGKSNKEIAALNYVELSTVKTHINNIYNKLGIQNRREAINAYKKLIPLN